MGRRNAAAFSPESPNPPLIPEEIEAWDVVSGRERAGPEGVTGWIRSVAISPDDRNVGCGDSGRVRPEGHALGSGNAKGARNAGPRGSVPSIAFSPEGRTLAAGCHDGTIKLWNPSNGEESGSLAVLGRDQYYMRYSVRSIAFAPDGKLLAAGLGTCGMQLFDMSTGRLRAVIEGQGCEVTSVLFSPRGELLASGGWERTIRLLGLAVDSRDKIGP